MVASDVKVNDAGKVKIAQTSKTLAWSLENVLCSPFFANSFRRPFILTASFLTISVPSLGLLVEIMLLVELKMGNY